MKRWMCLLISVMLLFGANAWAAGFDAQMAQAWITQMAQRLPDMPASNDPAMTADPSRAGQMLFAFDFGTVLSSGKDITAESVMEIELRGAQEADCRGVFVGMELAAALDGVWPDAGASSLYVLDTQESGVGWSWAYMGDHGVYGVEYVSYGGDGAQMKEYTLTYVIGGDGTISAIRLRAADATQAQAEQGLSTAIEIMGRQGGELLAAANGQNVVSMEDMTIGGRRVLDAPVSELIACVGEPEEIQSLPDGLGGILVYEGMVVQLGVRDATGEEIVLSVTTNDASVAGPRGLTVGMSVQEAAALFRCDNEVSTAGGILYLEGEASGEPPFGELVAAGAGTEILRYVFSSEEGRAARLEVGIQDGYAAYWHMVVDMQEQ